MEQVKNAATTHPRDAHGRILPDPGWPAERAAPGPLEFVRRFANSINRENGAERFTDAVAVDAWLADEGRPPVAADRAGLARLIALREALHDIAVSHTHGDRPPAAAWERLVEAGSGARIGFAVGETGLSLAVLDRGVVAGLCGELLLACHDAVRGGTFDRLKACAHCHWVVYDGSKNASARWCSMRACGTRHNAGEYRRRRRAMTIER